MLQADGKDGRITADQLERTRARLVIMPEAIKHAEGILRDASEAITVIAQHGAVAARLAGVAVDEVSQFMAEFIELVTTHHRLSETVSGYAEAAAG